jgi:curved DNA-binding protein CbpA
MNGRLDEALKVLGIPADSDRRTVASAYRRLARATHPDLSPDPDAAARFAAVSAAYRLVSAVPQSGFGARPLAEDRPASTRSFIRWSAPRGPYPYEAEDSTDFTDDWPAPAPYPDGAHLLVSVSPVVPGRLWGRPPIVAGPVVVRPVQSDAGHGGSHG